jgi:hypothetical protein
VPQSDGDNPIKQGEENANDEGAQEEVSEEDNFLAFHSSSVISSWGLVARLWEPTKSA